MRALLLTLALLDPSEPGSSPASLPEPLERQAELLHTGSLEERKAAVAELIGSGDERVLPDLSLALEEASGEYEPLLPIVTRGVIQGFPEQAPEFLIRLVEEGTSRQQLAAGHSLGWVADPRVVPVLKRLLSGDDQRLRTAAAYSLMMRGLDTVRDSENRIARLSRDPLPQGNLERHGEVRQVLFEVLGLERPPANEVHEVLARFANHDLARIAMERFTSSLPPEQERLALLLPRMLDANRRWLGRPVLPQIDEVSYSLRLRLLTEKEPQIIPRRFSAEDLDLVRARRIDLDRSIELDLPLDKLLVIAGRTGPRLLDPSEDGAERIEYDIPSYVPIHVALGTGGYSLWSSRAQETTRAVVRVDPRRAVPLSEDVLDAAGQLVARLEYSQYKQLRDGSWVPRRVVVDFLKAVAVAEVRHLRYDLRFRVARGDFWTFSKGKVTEITNDGLVPRAEARQQKLVVVPPKK